MLRLTKTQRTLVAEKLCDAGNLAAGALIFGQFLAEKFSLWIAAGGFFLWLLFVGSALGLVRRNGQ